MCGKLVVSVYHLQEKYSLDNKKYCNKVRFKFQNIRFNHSIVNTPKELLENQLVRVYIVTSVTYSGFQTKVKCLKCQTDRDEWLIEEK